MTDHEHELPLADDETHAVLYDLLVDAAAEVPAATDPEPRSDDENA